jgi:hypothetical protein
LCDFHLVVEARNARYSLATTDTKLPFIECIYATEDRNNALACYDFNRPQPREVLSQKIGYPPLQLTVQSFKSRFASMHCSSSFDDHPLPCLACPIDAIDVPANGVISKQQGGQPMLQILFNGGTIFARKV